MCERLCNLLDKEDLNDIDIDNINIDSIDDLTEVFIDLVGKMIDLDRTDEIDEDSENADIGELYESEPWNNIIDDEPEQQQQVKPKSNQKTNKKASSKKNVNTCVLGSESTNITKKIDEKTDSCDEFIKGECICSTGLTKEMKRLTREHNMDVNEAAGKLVKRQIDQLGEVLIEKRCIIERYKRNSDYVPTKRKKSKYQKRSMEDRIYTTMSSVESMIKKQIINRLDKNFVDENGDITSKRLEDKMKQIITMIEDWWYGENDENDD